MTTRSWLDSPDLTVQTPFGSGKLVFTGGQHIYFDAHVNSGSDPSVGLTVRGVRYGVNAHFARVGAGWKIEALQSGRDQLYVSRADWTRRDTPVSPSARAAIRAAVEGAVNAAAQAHPNLVAAGEQRHANNALLDLEAKLAEAEAEVARLRGEIAKHNAVLGEA
jgi:hypothetical protein